MARGGGSGGRSSGGSSSGSRSSGGRSSSSSSRSGGRSGSSSSSSGRSGGFFTRRSGRVFPGPFSGGGYSSGGGHSTGGGHPGGGYSGGSGSSGTGTGCGCSTMVIIAMILIIIVVFIMLGTGSIFSGGDITKSTAERVALPAGAVNETGYYTDELGWISNETKLLTGLKYFHKKTGVQPYLYIMDNVNGSHHPTESELDAFTNELYDRLFTDEAHLLLVFFEYNNAYMDRYVCGTQAKTVIDAEAADILLDYIDRYYYDDSLTDEEFFSKAFSDAADRIMTVTRSPWISVMSVFALLALAVVLFTWWNMAKRQKDLEARRMEEILKTPLEKFDDLEAEKLAKKYEDPDPKS